MAPCRPPGVLCSPRLGGCSVRAALGSGWQVAPRRAGPSPLPIIAHPCGRPGLCSGAQSWALGASGEWTLDRKIFLLKKQDKQTPKNLEKLCVGQMLWQGELRALPTSASQCQPLRFSCSFRPTHCHEEASGGGLGTQLLPISALAVAAV